MDGWRGGGIEQEIASFVWNVVVWQYGTIYGPTALRPRTTYQSVYRACWRQLGACYGQATASRAAAVQRQSVIIDNDSTCAIFYQDNVVIGRLVVGFDLLD